MEDANGGLYVLEGSISNIGQKKKQPATMKDEEWEVVDRKALGTIRLCLDSSMSFNISKENTMEGVMSALDKLYEKSRLLTRYV